MSVPVRVMPGKVLIQPDVEAQAVEARDSGILLAKTLTAAVEGDDARESWYSGTVIAMNHADLDFDVRPYLRRHLVDLLDAATYEDAMRGIGTLLTDLDRLPQVRERGFRVGDAVTFSHTAGQELTIDGTTYLILDERELLGVLQPYEELTHA